MRLSHIFHLPVCFPSCHAHDFEGSFVHLLPLIRKKNHPCCIPCLCPCSMFAAATTIAPQGKERSDDDDRKRWWRTRKPNREQRERHTAATATQTRREFMCYYITILHSTRNAYMRGICVKCMCICMKCMRVWVSVLRCASDSVLGDNVGGRRCLRTLNRGGILRYRSRVLKKETTTKLYSTF